MPQVQRHEPLEDWLYAAAQNYLDRKRSGIHVSYLLMPRKRYFAEVVPRKPTRREIGYFLAGRAHEEVVMVATHLGRRRKVTGSWEGIGYEIDALATSGDGQETPTEFKTNRRPKVLEPSEVLAEYELAIAQLGSYVAAKKDRGTGYLVEFHLKAQNEEERGDSEPRLVVYQIDWSDEELESIRMWMRLRRDMILEALAKRDHTILPQCPEWACGKEFVKFFDPHCPGCGRIYPVGEEKDDGTKTGVKRKCEDCRDGKARVDLVRPSETKWLATCRWFDACRPEQWERHWPVVDTGLPDAVESDKTSATAD